MKYKYIKRGKLNHQGNQYRQGDILELDSLGSLPANWFEAIEETESIEKIEKEEKPKKKQKEVIIDYGSD